MKCGLSPFAFNRLKQCFGFFFWTSGGKHLPNSQIFCPNSPPPPLNVKYGGGGGGGGGYRYTIKPFYLRPVMHLHNETECFIPY